MNLFPTFQDGFHRWIDCVAATIEAMIERLVTKREVEVIENAYDAFTLHASGEGKNPKRRLQLPDHHIRMVNGALAEGLPSDWATALRQSRVRMVLLPERFLFRPLELPKRAVEFLDGIVRSQIDRLTPWAANDAVFSWTPPIDAPNDRVALTIAATARALVAPYAQAIADYGATAVVVLTVPPPAGPQAVSLKVFEHRAKGALGIDRIRRALVALFVISGLAAVSTLGYAAIAAGTLDAEQQDVSRKVAARRAALRAGPEFAVSAQRMLERRKQTTPSAVMVLEALSQVLPDHTYITELHIEGDKLQLVGLTGDAPALIALIEQSPHFTRATFYAPTTHTPGETGERFHIEAQIKPIFEVGT
jgi:general secretion pathway protein L